jgi:hypothetical protein
MCTNVPHPPPEYRIRSTAPREDRGRDGNPPAVLEAIGCALERPNKRRPLFGCIFDAESAGGAEAFSGLLAMNKNGRPDCRRLLLGNTNRLCAAVQWRL